MFCLSKRRRTTRTQDSRLHPIPSSQTEEIPIEADAPLCSTCSTIDLRAILRYAIPPRHAVPLGKLIDIFDKCDQCGLCRLITTFIRRMWRLDGLPGIDLTGITCGLYTAESSTLQRLRDVHHHRLYIHTSHRPRDATIALDAAHLPFELEIQLLEEDASKLGRTEELHGRRVGQNVNIGLLKRWIHICENEHRKLCQAVWWRGAEEVLPKTVRVLDITRMAIVSAPPMCRYVALSYVWGGPGEGYWTTRANLRKRRMPGGLDGSVLPGTISDTIELVRQLGERYLWIDALCIVQDDLRDKAVQIRLMDVIYGSSAFTVFAAGGTSVRDPLPGIRPGTRDPQQQVVQTQGLHLAVPLTFLSEAITSSVWNQRGWTYQELMLSRRRIFFTAHQVHFECRADMWCEGVVAEPVGYPWAESYLKGYGPGAGSFTSAPLGRDDKAYMRDYKQIITQYTQRKFTDESDIVNAVAALLKALTKAYNVVVDGDYDKAFRFGMPLVDLPEALLWQPMANAPHSRRVPADGISAPWPSWSWAGWRGAARYNGVLVFVDIQTRPDTSSIDPESLVRQWYIIDHDYQPIRQDVRRSGHMGVDIQDADSRSYVAPHGDIDPQQMITKNAPLRPGTLVFQTSSARFNITRAGDVAGADDMTSHAIYSILMDTPRPSTLVGRVILPCSTSSPTSCEFIVLSRTGPCRGLYDQDVLRKPYIGCMLYVMAVQKMQDERMMERVGVGVIVEQAWLNSSTELKVVFLG